MQLLKIGFILSLVSSLCSFAYYSAQEDSREQLYKNFLSQFEQVDLPSKVILEAHIVTNEMKPLKRKKQLEKAKSEKEVLKILTKEYASFIPGIKQGLMSRMGPSTYKAEVALATTGKYSAVIYSRSRSFDGGAKSYILATFDGHGTPLKTHHLGYSDLEEKLELTISKKMELTTKRLFLGGNIKKYDKKTKKMFITPKGEILVHEEDKPLDEIEPVQKKANLKFS